MIPDTICKNININKDSRISSYLYQKYIQKIAGRVKKSKVNDKAKNIHLLLSFGKISIGGISFKIYTYFKFIKLSGICKSFSFTALMQVCKSFIDFAVTLTMSPLIDG